MYLLCAGAYVASDFTLIHAYPGKNSALVIFLKKDLWQRGTGTDERGGEGGTACMGRPSDAFEASGIRGQTGGRYEKKGFPFISTSSAAERWKKR